MRNVQLFILTLFATTGILLLTAGLALGQGKKGGQWNSIFNGKNLEGWTPKFAGEKVGVNYKNTFRVEGGLLKVSYENYDQFDGKFGHLFYKTPYSHYRIRAVYRFVGEQVTGAPEWAWRNNGLKLHSQPPGTMAKDQPSPVSVEVQLLGGNGTDERSTANMCSMGTHVVMNGELITQHCVNSDSRTYHGDQWVTVEAELRGSELFRHYVNGREVMSYSSLQYDTTDANARRLLPENPANLLIEEGYIAIQAESHPTHFRSIEIMPLNEE
ncbi:MAG: DUF1080 domain-containing protein [Balneolaceae bacterium]|nr:DUF1080 domain-containing protein [Balneolaceae bacterium]